MGRESKQSSSSKPRGDDASHRYHVRPPFLGACFIIGLQLALVPGFVHWQRCYESLGGGPAVSVQKIPDFSGKTPHPTVSRPLDPGDDVPEPNNE